MKNAKRNQILLVTLASSVTIAASASIFEFSSTNPMNSQEIIGGENVTDTTSAVYKSTVRLLVTGYYPKIGVSDSFKGKNTSWRCSGTIVRNNIIVTAAHCFPAVINVIDPATQKPVDITIESISAEVFHKLSPKVDTPFGAKVTRYVRHPQYKDFWTREVENTWNPREPINDIALAKIAKDIPADKSPVENIAEKSFVINPNDSLILAGYGKTLDGYILPEMRQVQVPYRKQLANKTDSFAGEGNPEQPHETPSPKGACSGDSGGPAYSNNKGVLTLMGVIVRGPGDDGGGCSSSMNILTDVRAYHDWILEEIDKM